MGMYDEIYPEGQARCAAGHVIPGCLQTKDLQAWSTLASLAIRDGRLVYIDDFGRTAGVNLERFIGEAAVYTHCDLCGPGQSGFGVWVEWLLEFKDGELVHARPNENAAPWGIPGELLNPDVALAGALADLRPHGIGKVMVALDMFFESTP